MNEPAMKAAHPHNAARHPQPQRVSPAQALVWLKAGWGYFIGNPGIWIAISVIFIVMLFVLGLVPLLGWAVVLIGGCDKTVPAQLMGAASANIPSIQLITGSMLTGSHRGEVVGACTDCRHSR